MSENRVMVNATIVSRDGEKKYGSFPVPGSNPSQAAGALKAQQKATDPKAKIIVHNTSRPQRA